MNENLQKFKSHLYCLEKYHICKQTKETVSVILVLSTAYKQEAEKSVYYLNEITDIIIFLSIQGLAFGGQNWKIDSGNKRNFLKLCQFFAKYDDLFQERFKK